MNLDYAATAPALASVAERVAAVLPYAGSVHRGAGVPSQRRERALRGGARDASAARLGARADRPRRLHAQHDRRHQPARRLRPGGRGDVVTLDVEHHANLLPWRRGACRAPRGRRTRRRSPETLARLDARAGRAPAALLAITGASNVTGEVAAARAARPRSPAATARARSSTPRSSRRTARSTSPPTGVDYLALSGHKAYAPYGAGVLVGPRRLARRAPSRTSPAAARCSTSRSTTCTWADRPAPPRGRHAEPRRRRRARGRARRARADLTARGPRGRAARRAARRPGGDRRRRRPCASGPTPRTRSAPSPSRSTATRPASSAPTSRPSTASASATAASARTRCSPASACRAARCARASALGSRLPTRHASSPRSSSSSPTARTASYAADARGLGAEDDHRDLTAWLGEDAGRATAPPCEGRRHA